MSQDFTMLERDALTGAYSRSALERCYTWLEARVGGGALSLSLLDLDHLKLVNDSFGHLRGDALLRHLVAVVEDLLEPEQLLVRYGGDEFVLLAPHDAGQAQRWAERLLEALHHSRVPGSPSLRASASVGCATRTAPGEPLTHLLERADLRMYAAKRAGRGRVGGDPGEQDAEQVGRLLERESALERVRVFLTGRGGSLRVQAEGGVGLSRFLAEVAVLGRTLGYAPLLFEGQRGASSRAGAALETGLLRFGLDPHTAPAQIAARLLEQPKAGPPLLLIDRPDRLDPDSLRAARALEAALGGAIWGISPGAAEGADCTLEPLSRAGFGRWLISRLGLNSPAAFADQLYQRVQGRPGWALRLLPALQREARARRVAVWELPETLLEALSTEPLPLEALPLLVGRGSEMRALLERLAHHPLTVLAGPGGVGKSALLRQMVREQQGHYERTIWLEEQDSIATVRARLLSAAGRGTLEGESEDAALERTLHRPHLIVLDAVGDPLALRDLLLPLLGDRGSRAVVASREEGGADLTLEGFTLPPQVLTSVEADLEELERAPAVRVFAARAALVSLDFRLEPQDAPLLRELCQRLEGLPQALELAAGWLELNPLSSVVQVLRREALSLLEAGSLREGRPGVRVVFEYLWEPLSFEERRALAGLCELPGPFSAQAAREVAGVSPLMLSGLRIKGMVLERGGRFALSALLRDFLLEQLEAQGLRGQVAGRWVGHLLRQVEALTQHGDALQRQRDHAALDTLRPALLQTCEALSSDPREARRVLHLCVLLRSYWLSRALLHEPCVWLERALAQLPPQVPQAAAWGVLGELRQHLGDHTEAAASHAEARRFALREGDPFALTDAELGLGRVAHRVSRYPEALEWYAQALEHARSCGDPLLEAAALTGMGRSRIYRGQLTQARAQVQRALTLLERLGDEVLILNALNTLGLIALEERRLEEARGYLEQALERHLRAGDALGAALNRTGLGWCALLRGDFQSALEQSQASLAVYSEHGGAWELCNALVNCGHARVRLAHPGDPGQLERARQHYHEGLELALRIEAYSVQGEALAGLAEVALERGQRSWAAQLFAGVAASEAANAEFWNYFGALGDRLPWRALVPQPLEALAQQVLREPSLVG